MAAEDLSTPLGQNAAPRRRGRHRLPLVVPRAIAGALALFIAAFAAWALVVDDPLGGEPHAIVAATGTAPEPALPKVIAGGPAAPRADAPAAPAPGTQTITIIDGSTGKREEVMIPARADARATLEQNLIETTPHGALPRIGPDGTRPAEAYAQAVRRNRARPDGPRVVIVITGLGIGASVTQQALDKLPGPVTFAFSPYGPGAERLVQRARSEGHEILLQIPMEPFDYPDNDPGPQTLLATLSQEQNIERLHWLMSRFQGYVGIANHMGARFTASEPALRPVLREAGKRRLIYFDDASSPRSQASQIAAGTGPLSFVKAEVTLDATPTQVHIERALTRLEAM